MRYTLFAISLILLCCFGCNERTRYSYELVQTAGFDIPGTIIHYNPALQYDLRRNGLWVSSEGYRLLYYDLHHHSILDSFTLPKAIQDRFEFYVDDDRVYILKRGENEIDECSREGEIISRYVYPDTDVYFETVYLAFEVVGKHVNLLAVPNLHILNESERQQYFSTQLITEITLKDSSIVRTDSFGKFPAAYKQRLYNDFHPIATTLSENTVAYCFSIDPVIYTHTENSTESHTIIGLNPNHFLPSNPDSAGDFSYDKQLAIRNEQYGKLLFDSSNKLFLLFQLHPANAKAEDGRLGLIDDKSFTVYLIDSTYRVIGLKEFEKIGDYLLNKAGIIDGNLYLPKMNNNEENLHFDCFRISKIPAQ